MSQKPYNSRVYETFRKGVTQNSYMFYVTSFRKTVIFLTNVGVSLILVL